MKKFLFTLVAIAIGLAASAQTATHVRVTPKSGEPLLVSFSQQPEITMLADGVRVTSAGSNASIFEFNNIDKIDFVNISAVEAVADGEDTIGIMAWPDRIEFYNVPEGSPLRVFSVSGQLVRSETVSGSATLLKSDFPHGVYVVVIGSSSFKLSL